MEGGQTKKNKRGISSRSYVPSAPDGVADRQTEEAGRKLNESEVGEMVGVLEQGCVGNCRHLDQHEQINLAASGLRMLLLANENEDRESICKILRSHFATSSLINKARIHAVVRAVFTREFFRRKEVERYAPFLKNLSSSDETSQRYIISAVEVVCAQQMPEYFPVLLKQLYDEDIIEEEEILDWAGAGRTVFTNYSVDEKCRENLRQHAESLVRWLEEAEEESSDEESNEEERSGGEISDEESK